MKHEKAMVSSTSPSPMLHESVNVLFELFAFSRWGWGIWAMNSGNAKYTLTLNYVGVNIKVTDITKVTQILDQFNFIYLDIWVQNYGTGSPAKMVGWLPVLIMFSKRIYIR